MSQYSELHLNVQPNIDLNTTGLTQKASEIVKPELLIESIEVPLQAKTDGALILRGRLLVHNDRFFSRWVNQFRQIGYTPVLRQDGEQAGFVTLRIMEGIPRKTTPRVWINVSLFVITFFSTLYFGAIYSGIETASLLAILKPVNLIRGLPFAMTLLGILGAHEFGHYFAARYHRVDVSLPYFIPIPPPLGFGTLGAVIRMGEPVPDRRKLFDIGVAGPIAGLAIAIPLLIIGLASSQTAVLDMTEGVVREGNSILYYLAKIAVFGKALPDFSTGEDVMMNQMTLAAWFGLMVTAINLLPVGQLDGGHTVYAVFGKYARYINRVTLAFMALLAVAGLPPLQRIVPGLESVGFVGWFLWLVIIFVVVGPYHPPALDDVNELDTNRRLLGYAVILLFIVLFVPVPMHFS